MWLEVVSCVSVVAVLYVLTLVLATIVRNRKAHQFFKKRSPNLPVAPNLGVFGGHINEFIWAKRNWKIATDLHKKYGKTVGLFYCDKPVVSTIDLDLIKAMVFDNPHDHVNRIVANSPVEELEKDCIFTCEEVQWRKIRRAVAPAFTKCKIMQPNVQMEIETVIDKLIESLESRLDSAKLKRSEKSAKLDADDIFLRYATALVLSCFYKQDKIVDFSAPKDHFTQTIDMAIRNCVNPIFRLCIMFPSIIPVVNWLMLRFHPLGLMRKRLISFIKRQTLINLQAKQQVSRAKHSHETSTASARRNFDVDNFILDDGTKFRRNMIDYVIDQFLEGNLTEREYTHNAFFLFLAGVKTTADAISKLVYNLAAHPDEQEKLRTAIDNEGAGSEYLSWCINESMRLFPSGTAGCTRRLAYDLETEGGITVPGGTLVYTHPNVIHRLPEYWGPDANEFKPERWRHAGDFHPAQFIPFGAGKRGCLGKEFALIEMRRLMSELLERFRFRCSPDTDANSIMQFDTYLIFTISNLPVNIEISRL